MFVARLERSPRKGKKWRMVFFFNGRKYGYTDFGASGYEDYTIHRDNARKQKYLRRFRQLIAYYENDFTAPITLSTMILWNKPTIQQSFAAYKRKYKLN